MKRAFIFLLIVVLALTAFSSCGKTNHSTTESQSEKPKPTTININTDGGKMDDNLDMNDDTTFDDIIASIPSKDGYAFAGWYSDKDFKDYIFPNHITTTQYEKGTAYAKWIDPSPVSYDVRDYSVTITDSGREKQHMDKIDVSSDFDILDLRRAGYTSLNVKVSMSLKEVDDGNQYVFIYRDTACTSKEISLMEIYDTYVFGKPPAEDPSLLFMYHYEHGAGEKNTSWNVITFEAKLDIDNLRENLYLRYGASGKWDDNWCNNNVKVTVTPMK